MDAASTGAISILTGLGLPGLIIGVLAFAVYKLYNRVQELQDKRLEDAREIITTTANITTALGNLSNVIEKRSPQ